MRVWDLRSRRSTPAPMLTAFVLGGGGNLGAVQVGMLRALFERGVAPDLVVGCSVGAVNGAAIAAYPSLDGVERLAEMWRRLQTEDVLSAPRLTGVWQLARKGDALHGNGRLRALIEEFLPFERLEDAPVPLHVVATAWETGLERWFTTGPAVDAILASAALPSVLPPVRIDGQLYIDGGVVDNVPISRAVEQGARRVYVLHPGNFFRARPDPRRPVDVLLAAFSMARNHRFLVESAQQWPGVELVVLPAIDPGAHRFNDFSHSAELIEGSHEAAAAFLDDRTASAAGAAGAAGR